MTTSARPGIMLTRARFGNKGSELATRARPGIKGKSGEQVLGLKIRTMLGTKGQA